ncbi:hypothetical protein Tco_0748601 [Tanacetum coccineum]|uniref:Uncharacterized protein n=1 Tax=Tanacetum coccineum TaxID=301880 RepID=A0ABQ4YYU7_9ASTR
MVIAMMEGVLKLVKKRGVQYLLTWRGHIQEIKDLMINSLSTRSKQIFNLNVLSSEIQVTSIVNSGIGNKNLCRFAFPRNTSSLYPLLVELFKQNDGEAVIHLSSDLQKAKLLLMLIVRAVGYSISSPELVLLMIHVPQLKRYSIVERDIIKLRCMETCFRSGQREKLCDMESCVYFMSLACTDRHKSRATIAGLMFVEEIEHALALLKLESLFLVNSFPSV